MTYYFAYGSNMDRHAMSKRCPGSVVVGRASLREYRLDFTKRSANWNGGVADIVRAAGHEVWGVLYIVTPADVDALDWHEGVPDHYLRVEVAVQVGTGDPVRAWAYEVRDKASFTAPSRRYLGVIKAAAVELQFPGPYRALLEKVPVADG